MFKIRLFLMYDLCMRVFIAISLFNKDAGLHAILVLKRGGGVA